jgi:phosphohistidine swiveling domain-containing protein
MVSAMSASSQVVDPLHTPAAGDSWWSTTNLSEAFPGVLTPLDWTVIGPAVERATRGALVSVGALPPSEADVPEDPAERTFAIFHGRIASRIDWFHHVGAVMPGTSPDAVVTQIFGSVPEGLSSRPSVRRYPVVAARFPLTFAGAPGRTRAMRAATRRWWESEIKGMPGRTPDEARTAFLAGVARMTENLTIDGTLLLAGAQPIYDQLTRLASIAGVDPSALMRGAGSHEETQVVADVWECSRDRLPFRIVLERHGFHGPHEGVPSGRPWREDPGPLRALIASFASLPEDADPRAAEERGREERRRAERELLAGVGPVRRRVAAFVLRLAHMYLPLRGKAARTQAIDVVRAAARRIGEALAEDGILEQADDVQFLTADEVAVPVGPEVRERIVQRRARYEEHLRHDLPGMFRGQPVPLLVQTGHDEADDRGEVRLQGVGASTGVVEARARVVLDIDDAGELEPGEILVTRTTDPSWAAPMFVSGGLVVDIGGLLSHAAIVARELGVPCVMGTGSGTTRVRTGDRCRVDGTAGTVEVLGRE